VSYTIDQIKTNNQTHTNANPGYGTCLLSVFVFKRAQVWRFSKSNGITEGFHTKMEMLSRRAYGFRNFENYRLRVLAHCGWDGIINRV